jgi:hypothetical protein
LGRELGKGGLTTARAGVRKFWEREGPHQPNEGDMGGGMYVRGGGQAAGGGGGGWTWEVVDKRTVETCGSCSACPVTAAVAA